MINSADFQSIKLNGTDVVQTSLSKIEDGTKKNYFSLFPTQEKIREGIPKSFIINNPMNTVGGDGYWYEKQNNQVMLAVFDCMGHGHIASMMTRVYIKNLKRILSESGMVYPHQILSDLHEAIKNKFDKKGNKQLGTGADFGVVRINFNINEMEFSGAKMNLYEVENGKLNILKADRMQVGEYFDHEHKYTTQVVDLNRKKNSKFYLFSDGLKDLIGGPENKKFGSTRLKNLLESNHHLSMDKQQAYISEYLAKWQGSNSALDDTLLIGFSI